MKKNSLLLMVSLLPCFLFAQKIIETPFEVQGTVGLPVYDASSRVIYFTYYKNGQYVNDSSVVKENKFVFKAKGDFDVKAVLQFTKPGAATNETADPNTLNFYLSSGIVTVNAKGYLRKAEVKGSAMNDAYASFKKSTSKFDMPFRQLSRQMRNVKEEDTLRRKTLKMKMDSVQNLRATQLSAFLSKDIKKPYASEAILMYLNATNNSSADSNEGQHFFNELPAKQKLTATGKEISKLLAKQKESVFTMNVLSDLDFYDLYGQPVNAKMPPGITALSNTEVIRQLSTSERERIGKSLAVKLTLKSRCDNYDRVGNVLLATMPKGEKFDKEKCELFEMLRFITPFMYRNREPDHVPYEAQADQLVNVIKQTDKDVYLFVTVGGTTGAGQAEVAGCNGSNITFNITVDFVCGKGNADMQQKGMALLDRYSIDNKEKTAGKNSKQVSFELPDDTKATTLYMVSSGHGAAEGGEEYDWRAHVINLDGKEYARLDMNQDCTPYEIYNTQPNGIYTGDMTKERRSWCPGGMVPAKIVNLGPLPKGKHTLKISIPDADFDKTDSKYYVSAYLILE